MMMGKCGGGGKIIYREQTKLESHDVATSRCDINHLIVRSTEGPKSLTQNNDDNRGGGCRKYRCSIVLTRYSEIKRNGGNNKKLIYYKPERNLINTPTIVMYHETTNSLSLIFV